MSAWPEPVTADEARRRTDAGEFHTLTLKPHGSETEYRMAFVDLGRTPDVLTLIRMEMMDEAQS